MTSTVGVALSSTVRTAAFASPGDAPWIEATIPQIQALMQSGELTSLELTRGYLRRIADLNPLLRAVIETNPNAEAIAAHLDSERRKGGPMIWNRSSTRAASRNSSGL